MGNREKTFCLEVWGDYACFTRPEMKVERVSYDVITPSAARAIFEAIFWKPAIRWHIRQIEVLSPIRWISVRRNETGATASTRTKEIFIEEKRQQRAGLFLRDVHYRLYGWLEYIPVSKRKESGNPVPNYLLDKSEKKDNWASFEAYQAGKDENPGKYLAMFDRRARKGQCFTQPYLGCREFSAFFKLVDEPLQEKCQPIADDRDLGFMLYDFDFTNLEAPLPMFYRPEMKQGRVVVPNRQSGEVFR